MEQQNSKIGSIVIAVVVTAIIVGGGMYWWFWAKITDSQVQPIATAPASVEKSISVDQNTINDLIDIVCNADLSDKLKENESVIVMRDGKQTSPYDLYVGLCKPKGEQQY